ncbi:uncharacterized protein P174DRAFT_512079 [Aspergillus novofumigatus IBT 16806]|uniref:EBP-domain-containing protein n=1 Tax=Aspergillus novofumigatus (strain IBT 16806) TaxID=1392255 RepID=A0A2I1C859_ASPN1|nr:EBP-domain-containing protein [Aspergillus novofumigatus IBT 16806]PKX93819.1 EBP-domain-containing protein [Aspergillus novofumigatus IBT 16806]
MSSQVSSHPYYPLDAHIKEYAPNETSIQRLLTTSSIAASVILGGTLTWASFMRPSLSKADRFAILWFVLSGTIHCFFEGYFIIHHDHMASAQDFLGQLWKEYALSDSRYMTSDTLVLCLETMTVFIWGPLCFFVAYLILNQHSLRHPLQLIVCMSHLYGDTLYYATSLYDHYAHGRSYCRPEAYYFWIYYFLMNFIWIIIPFYIGVPLGLYDTNSVREKVRGVITATDVVYYEDDDENSTSEAKSKPVKDTTRKRSNSTPRKRLISDEHWKLNRTSAQTPTPKLPPPKRISQLGRKEGRKDGEERSAPSSRSRDRERAGGASDSTIKERRKSRASRDVDSATESKTEDEVQQRGSSKSTSRPGTANRSQCGEALEPLESSKKKGEVTEEDADWAASEADFSELSRRRARGPGPKTPPKSRAPLKPLRQSRKMFARPEPPKPAPTRGSKIEAWLSSTSDPFLEDMDPDVEVPAPLNTRTNRAKPSHKREDKHDRNADSEPSPESESLRRSTSKRHGRSREGSATSERKKSEERKISSKQLRDDSSPIHRKKSSEPRHSRSSSGAKEATTRDTDLKADDHDTDTQPFSDGSEVSGNNAPVPLIRKRPIPSTGLHRLSTIASIETMSADDAEERDLFDPNSLPVVSSQLKRRLTTHDDLMSVLSVPNTRSRSLRSARSLRTNKSRATNATVADLLKELAADEVKYMRELKTLVGGVIPVLLTCVLSRSDSAIAAGLFRPSTDPKDELNFTKPIVDMGVAIERLKTLHKRIPQDNSDSLLTWAQGAQRVYREYLRAWRLGFRDVIVNLAPLEEGEVAQNADTKSLDEGMARDENGDVVNSEGEKVDVAYLLKRPLVRLKYLAKTFKGINMLAPSAKAEEIASVYQNLVTEARRRAREERARLEDESAASIDSTRARDPATLGALTDVAIDKSRRVRARDFFNLSLYHSTGQVVDCRAELLLRDNGPGNGAGGDLLICEIDHADRWLLFPPMDLACVSARNGDLKGEIVVMLRSPPGQTKAWQELLSLRIDEEDIAFEWVQLLGVNPPPPALCRTQSFIERAKQRQRAQTAPSSDVPPAQKRPPSPTSVDIPIGERATYRTARRSSTPKESLSEPSTVCETTSAIESSVCSAVTRESDYASTPRSPPSILHARDPRRTPLVDERASAGLKRSKAKRVHRPGESSPSSPQKDALSDKEQASATSHRDRQEDQNPIQSPVVVREKKPYTEQQSPKTPIRDTVDQGSPRVSSVPSMDLPSIPKIRKGSSQSYITESLASVSDDEEYAPVDSYSLPGSPSKSKGHSRSNSDSSQTNDEQPPPPPPHSRSPSSTGPSLPNTPRRRGSSPLKHEYEPSTASDTYSDSDTSTVRRYDMYSDSDDYTASDTSDGDSDDELASSLPSADAHNLAKSTLAASSSSSLSPSNSASQAKSSTAVASVFAWSEKGTWEAIAPTDCKVVAYEMSSKAMSGMDDEEHRGQGQLLIALELTPLVPIRRGTAIDISKSKINWSNNIMFRSRNADECEALYGLINQARINNPTYIALQNARGPFANQPTGRWFGWPQRRKSYRASNSPRVGTMSSAKMFNLSRSSITSRSAKEDSLHSSSAGSGSHHSSSGIGRIAAAMKGADGIGLSNAKIRLYVRETQSKWRDMGAARLTIMPARSAPRRPGTSSSRRSDTSVGADEGSPPTSGSISPRQATEPEKRIVVRGKTRGEVLLDVCLGESAFERVARTGIAVSIPEANDGAMPKEGGVIGKFSKIYMIQMKSEAEAAYTFGLVGKLRY